MTREPAMEESTRVAMLIDCDNISWRNADHILAEAATHGNLNIKRAYGDWSSGELRGWAKELPKHGIRPVQQFAYVAGKGATDSALIVDAMEILYTQDVDTFCIVASDSDYIALVTKLRESGKHVYGIGSIRTVLPFQRVFDRFTFIQVLVNGAVRNVDGSLVEIGEQEESDDIESTDPIVADLAPSGSSEESVPDIEDILIPAIKSSIKEDGWAKLATVGWYIVNNHPSFDSRNYGYDKLGQLVRELDFVEAVAFADDNGKDQLSVKLIARAT